MKNQSIFIVDQDQDNRAKIIEAAKKIAPHVAIIEAKEGYEAVKKMPSTAVTLFFANVGVPNAQHLFKSIENPYYKFARPKNYCLYAENFDISRYYIPKLDNLCLKKLPLDPGVIKEYISGIIAPSSKAKEQKKEQKKKYLKIPIEIVLRFGQAFPFDIFILIADKILKLSYADEDRQEQFTRYAQKGLTSVYVIREEYVNYLTNLRDNMRSKFADPDSVAPTEDNVTTLDSCYKAVKAVFDDKFVPAESIELAKELSSNSLKVIEKTPNIFQFFKDFREKCNQQYMISMITGFLTTCILDQFEWATSVIKEKLTLACMLCDITLDNEDIMEIKRCNDDPDKLSEKICLHPSSTRDLLRPNMKNLSNDVLNIIAEHHEKPDGTGYPAKLGHRQVNTLSAVFIVAYDFVNVLVEENFNSMAIDKTIQGFGQKYNVGHYRKVYNALHELFLK